MRTRAKSQQQQPLPQRSSNAPLLSTKPFLSQDVFRLVVRLEAQKALGDVDIGALERKFRVPLGYSEEDTHRKQEKLELDNLPGPGAYEVEDLWKLEDAPHQSAIFASRIDRDPYQLGSPRAKSASRQATSSLLPSPVNNSTVLNPQPSLGSFSRSSRGLETEPSSRRRRARTRAKNYQDQGTEPQSPSVPRSLLSTQSAIFPRVAKDKDSFISVSDRDLGPGLYDIRRFWDVRSPITDPDEQTWINNIQSDKPTSAVFGASREKRELMWSPARNPPSYAVPEAWNASPHYAKQKSKVLAVAEREAHKKKVTNELRKSKMKLESSQSTPGLSSLKHSTRLPISSASATNESLDPFEWLRRQPQGEQRANLLATKYGLLDQVRTLHHHHHTQHSEREDSGSNPQPVRPVLLHQNSQQELSHHQNNSASSGDQSQSQAQPQDATLNARDERIVISCRMPGGLMLSATLFSRKKVRHLKNAIVHKSHRRFTSDEQFDLFLSNGRKLANLEDTLFAYGLTTRSLVQIVPATSASAPPISIISPGPAPATDIQG